MYVPPHQQRARVQTAVNLRQVSHTRVAALITADSTVHMTSPQLHVHVRRAYRGDGGCMPAHVRPVEVTHRRSGGASKISRSRKHGAVRPAGLFPREPKSAVPHGA